MNATPSFLHRTVWRLARTPLAPVIKGIGRVGVREHLRMRQALASELPANPLAAERAADLSRQGWCELTDIIDPKLLQSAGDAAAAKYARGKQGDLHQDLKHKDFWTRLLDEDKVQGMLPTDNPFVAFALQPLVLQVLAGHYGELPFLDDVLLVLSRNTGKKLAMSQLWHRDYDDLRTVKLYIYLTEVKTMEDGPFTFLPAPVSDRLGSSLRSHRDDTEINARVRPEEMKVMIAPRLSVFMVETSRCLHMGSRVAEGHERLLYMATFISTPRVFPEPPPRFQLGGGESDAVRCVLTPARQADA
jgi:hypothetical protein